MRKQIQMLALSAFVVVGCSFLGSGSSNSTGQLKDHISASVLEEERAAAMLATVDQIDELLIESAEVLADSVASQQELFLDYDSKPDDFNALIDETKIRRKAIQQQLLTAHLELKSHATAEEWEQIRPVQVDVISARIDALVLDALEQKIEKESP